MLSRVAENVYWMARYVERAENIARLINVNTNLLLDLPRGIKIDWESLLYITGSREPFYEHYKEADERSVIRFLIANEKSPCSIMFCLSMARENFRTTRDIIPVDAIETINNLYLYAKEHINGAIPRKGRFKFLNEVIHTSQLNTGLLAGTMLHDEALCFVRIARNLERADMTTRILDVRSENPIAVSKDLTPFGSIQWMSILKSLTAYQMYRRYAHSRVRGDEVLRFILHHPKFPRSIVHCLHQLEGCLKSLPRSDSVLSVTEKVKSTLMNTDIEHIDFEGLRTFMDTLQIGIGQIHDQVEASYFPGHG